MSNAVALSNNRSDYLYHNGEVRVGDLWANIVYKLTIVILSVDDEYGRVEVLWYNGKNDEFNGTILMVPRLDLLQPYAPWALLVRVS